MASNQRGAQVDTALNSAGINTYAEVKEFRSEGRRRTTMQTVLGAIATAATSYFISRKRVRSDTKRLFNEGAL